MGNMGGPMARSLLKHGIAVVVHNLDPRMIQTLAEAGAEVAASPEAVAREAGRFICMVETTAQAEQVLVGTWLSARSAIRSPHQRQTVRQGGGAVDQASGDRCRARSFPLRQSGVIA
jgi:3-hydroxyisobutyrate dehydrogenase-like beta-hydroxyacid dehydrogenase